MIPRQWGTVAAHGPEEYRWNDERRVVEWKFPESRFEAHREWSELYSEEYVQAMVALFDTDEQEGSMIPRTWSAMTPFGLEEFRWREQLGYVESRYPHRNVIDREWSKLDERFYPIALAALFAADDGEGRE